MESLDRKITVLEPSYVKPIYIVQNSNMFPIRITIIDWTIPSGAVVYWQVRTSTKGEINNATVENNTVVIEPYISSFNEAGKGYLQIRIEDGNDKLLVSFAIDVYIQEDHVVESEGGNNSDYIKKLVVDYVDESVGTLFTDLEAQAQSELASIRDTGDAVIASIPSDYTALEQATYNAYPTESESGNPIYFDDGAKDIPVKELIVKLEPKQSGSGDPSPSNVRPISGYDGVTVKQTGKNLLLSGELRIYNGGTTQAVFESDGMHISGAKPQGHWADYLTFFSMQNLKANKSYILSLDVENSSLTWGLVLLRGSTELYSVATSTKSITITPTSDISYDRYRVSIRTDNSADVNAIVKPMLRLASANEEYELGTTEQTYSVTFPTSVGTVYGGSLNVTTGVLTVDTRMVTLNGSESWSTINVGYRISLSSANRGVSRSAKQKSNWLIPISTSDPDPTSTHDYKFNVASYVNVGGIASSLADFKSMLASNPLQIVYELATPITVQLAPTEVSTLLGSNTISSDGNINLTYRADTTMVIEKLTNAIISLGGNV